MVCLDTDILVGVLRNNGDAVNAISGLEEEKLPLCITVITTYELLKGAQLSANAEKNISLVNTLLANLHILSLEDAGANHAAKIYAYLSAKGNLINEFDILIAAICIANDETLVSNDADFSQIPQLKLKRW